MRRNRIARAAAAAAAGLWLAAAPPAAAAAEAPKEAAARPPGLPEAARVARALFTTRVERREPVDEVLVLDTRDRQVLFFTDLRGLQGRTVVHRWRHEGRTVAEVPFAVGGPRWRVYSRKRLDPASVGRWTVVVVDRETGWPLAAAAFEYREQAADASSRVVLPLARPGDAAPQPAAPAAGEASEASPVPSGPVSAPAAAPAGAPVPPPASGPTADAVP